MIMPIRNSLSSPKLDMAIKKLNRNKAADHDHINGKLIKVMFNFC